MNPGLIPFHLAVPVTDLESARRFYVNVLGCSIGRFSDTWVDYDFFGHQLTTHLVADTLVEELTNEVDGENVPVRHFGVILEWEQWHVLRDELVDRRVDFIIQPTIRFRGKPGEQATMFLSDHCGNTLEFKSFRDLNSIFLND